MAVYQNSHFAPLSQLRGVSVAVLAGRWVVNAADRLAMADRLTERADLCLDTGSAVADGLNSL